MGAWVRELKDARKPRYARAPSAPYAPPRGLKISRHAETKVKRRLGMMAAPKVQALLW